jgi:hypothetical protein
MFVAKAVQFQSNREQSMPHAAVLVSERVRFCRSACAQGMQQMLYASGVGHRDPSMRVALRATTTMWVRITQQKREREVELLAG